MHPKKLQRARVLLWWWLNYHPAEVGFAVPLEAETAGFGDGDYPDPDMIVIAENGYYVGSFDVATLYTITDPNRWHDVNLAVLAWLRGMNHDELRGTVKFLKRLKGRPLSQWQNRYTGQVAPDWYTLAENFLNRELI